MCSEGPALEQNPDDDDDDELWRYDSVKLILMLRLNNPGSVPYAVDFCSLLHVETNSMDEDNTIRNCNK